MATKQNLIIYIRVITTLSQSFPLMISITLLINYYYVHFPGGIPTTLQ